MIKKHSQFILGLFNQGCNILIPFIIIFISLKHLPSDIGGIWIIFLSMVVLINLFDFGLSPTIIRNVSYVIAGAQELSKDGVDGVGFKGSISYELLARLIYDIKKIYRAIALIGIIIIFFGGGGYFYYISPPQFQFEVLFAWYIFSAGLILNLYYLYYTPILTGLGVIQYAYLANVFGRVIWLSLSVLLYKYSDSLLMYSVTFFISVLCNRFLSVYFYSNNFHISMAKKVKKDLMSTIPYIANNAIKLGVVSLGSFLINRATVLIAGISLAIIVAGKYTFTLQVYGAMLAISNVFITIKIPELSKLVIQNNTKMIKSLIIQIIAVSLSMYVLVFMFFLLISDELIKITHSKISFLETKYLVILGIIFLLELNHSICATIITTKNKVPFAIPAIVSGVLIIVSSIVLTKIFLLGVIGLIMAQGIIQLCYNNWKWPYCVYNEFFKVNDNDE